MAREKKMMKEKVNQKQVKGVGYIRVSTLTQSEDGNSLDTQKEKIKTYCKLYSIDLVDIKVDAGKSGKSLENRDGILEALNMLDQGKASCLISSRLDRISRNISDINFIIKKYFMSTNKLVSIDEFFDTASPQGRCYINILTSFNTYEREIIGLRVKEVLSFLKSKNQRYSRHTVLGKKLASNNRIIRDKEEEKTINLAKSLREEGHSYCKIAKMLTLQGRLNRNQKQYQANQIIKMCNL